MHKQETTNTHPGRLSVRVYRKIAFIFLGPVLILAGVVLAATLSHATIIVVANKVPVTAQAKIAVAASTNTSDTVRGKIFSATLEDAVTATPKGDTVTRDAVATGLVTLTNKRAAAQVLVATTRLLTPDGVLFRTKNRVSIPAGGTLKNVEVYADKAGASGNIPPSRFTIPGLPSSLQTLVYAESSEAMAGGTVTVRGLSQSDIDDAVAALKEKIVEKALASFSEEIKASGFAGVVSEAEEVSRVVSANVGDSVDSFTVSLKTLVTAVAYDRSKFEKVAGENVGQAVPADMRLESTDVADVVPQIQNADPASGTATLAVTVSGVATISPENQILDKDRLTGLYATTVVGYLKSFSVISDAKVSLWPFWVRRTPSVKSHIDIIIQ